MPDAIDLRPLIIGVLGLPSWLDFQPFLYTGLALGGVYALSGVGMVVLYRATGVLFLAFGAVGAMGALIAWQLINGAGINQWLAYLICILFGGVVTLGYGMVFGRALAGREPLVKAVATLGLALILLGLMDLLWTSSGGETRSITLPTDSSGFMISQINVTWTQVIGLACGVVMTIVTGAFLRFTKLGTAMRALANDREITATLGVPIRRVEAAAWFGCGVLAGHRRRAFRRPRRAGRDNAHLPGDLLAGRDPDRSPAVDRRDVRGGDRDRAGRRDDHADPVHHQLSRHDAVRARRRRAARGQPPAHDLDLP